MNYQESLDYLYGLQQFGIKLGLENTRALLDRLGSPERAYPCAHVAGSNGKGSVCAALAEILRQGGCRTGLYTSPHLQSFTERIRIDGRAIAEEEVVALTDEVRRRGAGISATFFEFTTVMALLCFQRRQVGFAVLETGMGGRLDATNVVTPRVAVITSICRDHVEHLGNDPAAIAGEKAGIIKEGVPVVIGPQPPEVLQVLLEQARVRRAPVVLAGRDFEFREAQEGFSFRGLGLELEALRPGLAGSHQVENLSLALAAAGVLRAEGFDIPVEALRRGVEQVRWPGRLEWWNGRRRVLLDGAHNEGGARVLAAYLERLPHRGIRWVAAIKSKKEAGAILGPVLPLVTALYATILPVEQAVDPNRLLAAGAARGLPSRAFAEPEAALETALADCAENEMVLVAGSLFLVAAARQWLSRRENP